MMRITLVLILLFPFSISAQNYQTLFREGIEAYKNEQYPEMLSLVKQANKLRPNHQTIMYYVGMAYALNQKPDSANLWLQKVISIDAINYSMEGSEFDKLKPTVEYQKLLAYKNSLLLPGNNSDTVLVIFEPDMHIEDIAYDFIHSTFLVSSINHKNIYSVQKGKASAIFPSAFPYAITGMAVQDSVLWFTTAGFPEAGITEKDEHFEKSILYKADLNNYQLIDSFHVDDTEPHIFGDLYISSEGKVLISDGRQNTIYQLINGQLEKWLKPDSILSLQGITQVESTLFFADYVNGVYAVDLESRAYNLVSIPDGLSLSLKGIDGLYAFEGDLIAIQNGVKPNRITRLKLNKDRDSIENYQYVENNHPAMGEPTLGYIDTRELYYIANSFWSFNKAGVIENPTNLNPVILKVKLERN